LATTAGIYPAALVLDSENNLYLGGRNDSTNGVYLAKYDSDLNLLWSQNFGTGASISHIAVTSDGKLAVVGPIVTVINFGQGNLTSDNNCFLTPYFLVLFSSDGTSIWSISGSNCHNAYGVTAGANGAIFVTGARMNSFLSEEWIVTKFSSEGSQLWTYQSVASTYPSAYASVEDTSGNL